MKFQNPFFFCVILAVTIFFYKKNDEGRAIEPRMTKEFKLVVERGAFHYDRFEVTSTMITYFPEVNSKHIDVKYNSVSEVALVATRTRQFIEEIEDMGFWDLKNHYKASSSCQSGLKITLYVNGKSKSVVCDDFERDCHEVLKYIDKKVVELEGNDLRRIYLPG